MIRLKGFQYFGVTSGHTSLLRCLTLWAWRIPTGKATLGGIQHNHCYY